eukprot:m.78910 g.78910  ORF g.78910 m.78910 type:complete len:557 (-) comp14604_c0_seq4:125-1795(-)
MPGGANQGSKKGKQKKCSHLWTCKTPEPALDAECLLCKNSVQRLRKARDAQDPCALCEPLRLLLHNETEAGVAALTKLADDYRERGMEPFLQQFRHAVRQSELAIPELFKIRKLTPTELDDLNSWQPTELTRSELLAWVHDRLAGNMKSSERWRLQARVLRLNRLHAEERKRYQEIVERSEKKLKQLNHQHLRDKLSGKERGLEDTKARLATSREKANSGDSKAAAKAEKDERGIQELKRGIAELRMQLDSEEMTEAVQQHAEATAERDAFLMRIGLKQAEDDLEKLNSKGGQQNRSSGQAFEAASVRLLKDQYPGNTTMILTNVVLKNSSPPHGATAEFDAVVVDVVEARDVAAEAPASADAGARAPRPKRAHDVVVRAVVECKSASSDVFASYPKLALSLAWLRGEEDAVPEDSEQKTSPFVEATLVVNKKRLRFTTHSFANIHPKEGGVFYMTRPHRFSAPSGQVEQVLTKVLECVNLSDDGTLLPLGDQPDTLGAYCEKLVRRHMPRDEVAEAGVRHMASKDHLWVLETPCPIDLLTFQPQSDDDDADDASQ